MAKFQKDVKFYIALSAEGEVGMLSDTTLFCLAYLSDEQIEAEGGIPSATLAAMREDTKATAEFANSYLIGMGLKQEAFSEMPEYPDFSIGEEPVWPEL